LSSNDTPEKDIYDIRESNKTYEPIPESVNANNIIFDSEKPMPKNIASYGHYDEGNIKISIL